MAELTNTYWNGNGQNEEKLKQLNDLMPNWGMTGNKYMNLFITASSVYYDVNNNGGGNLQSMKGFNDGYEDKIKEYIVPFADELKSLRLNVKMETLIKNFKNEAKLERFLDEVILYVQDKDLSYDKHTIYFDNEKEQLSETEIEGFHVITFGNEEECKNWVEFRMNSWNYKMVG